MSVAAGQRESVRPLPRDRDIGTIYRQKDGSGRGPDGSSRLGVDSTATVGP